MRAPNMDAPGEVGTEGRAQGTADTEILAEAAAYRTAVAQADAKFHALRRAFWARGFEMVATTTNTRPTFMVSRWGLVREFSTLAEVQQFAAQAGVKP